MEDISTDREKQNASSKAVELAFPKYESEEDDQYISKGGPGEGLVKHLSTSMDAISDWFKQYQVESIELWISGLIESGTVTKLVVSAKGEGGMRVTLKPKSSQQKKHVGQDILISDLYRQYRELRL